MNSWEASSCGSRCSFFPQHPYLKQQLPGIRILCHWGSGPQQWATSESKARALRSGAAWRAACHAAAATASGAQQRQQWYTAPAAGSHRRWLGRSMSRYYCQSRHRLCRYRWRCNCWSRRRLFMLLVLLLSGQFKRRCLRGCDVTRRHLRQRLRQLVNSRTLRCIHSTALSCWCLLFMSSSFHTGRWLHQSGWFRRCYLKCWLLLNDRGDRAALHGHGCTSRHQARAHARAAVQPTAAPMAPALACRQLRTTPQARSQIC